MRKSIVLALLCSVIVSIITGCNKRENIMVVIDDVIVTEHNQMMIPLVATFEALGSTVTQEGQDYIFFDFNRVELVAKLGAITPNTTSRRHDYLYITKVEYMDSIFTKDHIMLWTMSAGGYFRRVNGVVYLGQEATWRLFEALGCTVEFDFENEVFRVSRVFR